MIREKGEVGMLATRKKETRLPDGIELPLDEEKVEGEIIFCDKALHCHKGDYKQQTCLLHYRAKVKNGLYEKRELAFIPETRGLNDGQ